MDKRFEIPFLLDLYGKLLTVNQKEILELYYESDLSLGEIAENKSKSRQAVHDLLKRSEKILYDYESKLQYLKNKFEAERLKKDLGEFVEGDYDEQNIKKCLGDVLKFLNEIY